jgi:hypothetical protein
VNPQTAIPVEAHVPESGLCAWCGKLAHTTIEVEPARFRNHYGVRVVAKPARQAWACPTHYRSIARVNR